MARRALAEYGVAADADLTLLNVSENATYAVDDPSTGERTVLRVHRHGYHDRVAIESELAWLDALRDEAGVRTPRVLPTVSGERLLACPRTAARPAVRGPLRVPPRRRAGADRRWAPRFVRDARRDHRTMHEHAVSWQRPQGFTRFAWDYDGAFGHLPRWGRWQDGIAIGREEEEVLGRLDATVRRVSLASAASLTATASCMPTSAWRTCSRTATRRT